MGFTKTGIINSNTKISKVESKEELEKFAELGEEMTKKACDEMIRNNVKNDNQKDK